MTHNRLGNLLLALLALPVAACGGSGSGTTPTPTPTPAASVSITPSTASVNLGGVQQFTAAVSGASNTAVSWTVNEGSDGGAVSSAGLFTASGLNGVYHVKATSQADSTASATASVDVAANSWKLVWSDEFNGAAGAKPDATKWTYETASPGWVNHELECYTDSTDNVALDGAGNLVITAQHNPGASCPHGGAADYFSGRVKTQNLFTQKYGRVEARMKLPYGSGLWPAFWMLGSDIDTVSWPACGEIDIMENVPQLGHNGIQSSLHSTGFDTGKPTTLSGNIDADFHTYGVTWGHDKIEFYVDDPSKPFVTYKASDLSSSQTWNFNHPFYLLLNFAVGGDWPKAPTDPSVFPAKMYVDYVRVYSAQ